MNLIYQALYLKDSHILTVRQVSATEIYTCLTSVQLRDSLFLMVYVPLQTLSTPALIYVLLLDTHHTSSCNEEKRLNFHINNLEN